MSTSVKLHTAILATAVNAGLAAQSIFVGLAVFCGCMFIGYLVEFAVND